MKKIVAFGEIMLRLTPPGFHRFSQALKDVSIKPEVKSTYLDITDLEGNLVHLLWLPKT